MIQYVQCLHMGSLRRNLFHKEECDVAISTLIESVYDQLEKTSQVAKVVNIAAQINKLN